MRKLTGLLCDVCGQPKIIRYAHFITGRYSNNHRECLRILKTCLQCRGEYVVPAHRKSSKFCSAKCRSLNTYLRVKESGFGSRKGCIPWNKGIRTSLIPHSAFKKGGTPWNRGTADLLKRRLNSTLKCAVSRSLKTKKNGRHWESLVGWNLGQLMGHLEKQFKDGMDWGNYGEWHLDHIIPLAVFNMSSFESLDFQRAWSLSNLQPLWKKENLKKNQKLNKPFQPSLDMAKWTSEKYE